MISSISPKDMPDLHHPVALSATEQRCLRCIAARMIPASEEFGLPAADDEAIFADIAGSVRRDAESLKRLLAIVDEAAGGSLYALPQEEQASLLMRLRAGDPAGFAVAEVVIARAYYRDDRVLRSIGMEPRPPFPKGYPLPETDWSLLEPVRARGSVCRPAD